MASLIAPERSKKAVARAGQRIANGTADIDDYVVLERWRGSHAYVINTFQANLRRRTRATEAVVGTRLKRRDTIINKLRRFPTMQLSRMHDIAGCRIIFPSLSDLTEFRSSFHQARFSHKRRSTDSEKWDYIAHPKPDGYRGIHDVYEYDVRSASGQTWNGLLIEIQYRTFIQHSWATAVEVAGLLTANNPKLGQGSPEYIEFFAICSELLARNYENSTSCYPAAEYTHLVHRLQEIEHNSRILQMFRGVNSKVVNINFKQNNILIFPFVSGENENQSDLEVQSFGSVSTAIERYNSLERDLEGRADVVLVRSDTFENMRISFRNYFADTSDFVRMIDSCVAEY